ncbi:MAG TPA: hypothetical protein VFS43_11775 [Polyangiaceae bacterium]|nr:hypothetical protein [Polyangiaceae bacterium]
MAKCIGGLGRLGGALSSLLGMAAAATCVGGDEGEGYDVAGAPPVTGEVAPGGILFVTQVPVAGFNVVTSAFGNHIADVGRAPRGGDLWVRYDDGTLRNLTAEAGFGEEGRQGAKAIAVREPSVHWGGQKALFSMVIGAPTERYGAAGGYRWQIYEVEGLGRGERARITKVPNQPADYDNVAPFYGADDRVLFASTRPRTGEAHLYPQLDEYESAPTTVGLYSLEPSTGDLFLVNHAPSGVFSPFIDSAGRVVYTKWDHLQRDQQEEADRLDGASFGAFNWADESAGASRGEAAESFPEPRAAEDPRLGDDQSPHLFNQFFPWQVAEDGSGEETLNHVGRHEFGGTYSEGSVPSDPNLTYLTPDDAHENRVYIRDAGGLFQLAEDPNAPGTFYATNAPEFATETAGQIVRFTGGLELNPERMVVTELTPAVTRNALDGRGDPAHTGHYRDPLPLASGRVVVSHTREVRANADDGDDRSPAVRYAFRLRVLEDRGGGVFAAGAPLTAGIRESLSWWTPDELASWEGELWELDAVEIRARPRPAAPAQALPAPERAIFEQEGVDDRALRAWLAERSLALVVSRDVTSRDRADVQQPFNLRVPGGVESVATGGRIYDVAALQLFQADQVRGYEGREGRRSLARPLHDEGAAGYLGGAAAGSARVAPDGSVASFVPARRAMSWQLVGPEGGPVVRERTWVSFAPGEVRVCPSCHGVNTSDQLGRPEPQNPPEALRALLQTWKADRGG